MFHPFSHVVSEDTGGTVKITAFCKSSRLFRWIIKSIRKTPDAWQKDIPTCETAYRHVKYGIKVVKPDGFLQPLYVSLKDERIVPHPFWRLLIRLRLRILILDRIHKGLFGW